jgi:hypothetical protein
MAKTLMQSVVKQRQKERTRLEYELHWVPAARCRRQSAKVRGSISRPRLLFGKWIIH